MSRRFMTACVLTTLVLAGGLAWGACWDDQSFFTVNVRPRAMFVLDRSGSMAWCFNGGGGCGWGNWNQRLTAMCYLNGALFKVLDADSSGTINAADELALGVDIGYSEFYNTSPIVPYMGDTMGRPYAILWSHINRSSASGGTPCALTAWNALSYVVSRRNLDPLRACRPYFIIVVTDGGSNSDGWCPNDVYYADDSYKSGRYSEMNVSYTSKTTYGIPMYWVGMGSTMPATLNNTLNWAAYAGGTNDLTWADSGNTLGCSPRVLTGVPDCTWLGGNPGDNFLRGRAFIGTDGTRLANSLKAIFKQIQQSGGQTFAMSTLPANFAKGAMYYWASFEPKPAPRWIGHVAALKFYADGSPPFDSLTGRLDSSRIVWDAGNILRSRQIDTDPLTIYTWTGTNRRTMLNDYSRVLPETLGFAAGDTTSQRRTVRFVYGDSVSGGHTWGWLNDPFHGYTVEVKEPSWIYLPSVPSYIQFVNQYRTRPARVHVMVNDGKLHCFNGDTISPPGGRELWSYVPRHMLTRLSAMRAGHQYTMDGPLVVRHIYAYAESALSAPDWKNWRTVLFGGERNGGRYYFALDVTDPSAAIDPLRVKRPYPWPMWEVGPTTAGLADMGATWSTPSIWKMRFQRGGNPHRPDTSWVAVVGGGFDCTDLTKGRFIAVLDAFSGEVIRRLDLGGNAGPVAGPVTLADFDRNGTVDHLYVGDLNGNVWRFDVSDSVVANWQRSPNAAFFDDPNNRPIYGGITLGASGLDSTWIYFGTGDRDNPYSQLNNRFYGIRDLMDNNPVAIGNLHDATSATCNTPGALGWYKRISSASDTSAIFTMPITAKFSDSVFTMGWKAPSGSAVVCSAGAAGNTYLYSFYKTCGYSTDPNWRRFIAPGMPPGEFPHGIDRRGRHKGVAIRRMVHLETYLIGKIVKSWREVY